ncbi:MAG: hypothetical protein ACJ790_00170, partial [Myxococcaceae bacterium]
MRSLRVLAAVPLLVSTVALAQEYRERTSGHRCGEDELLARLSKQPGDMVDKLLKVRPAGSACEDGPENPLPPLIAEVTCSSHGSELKPRLAKLTKNLGVVSLVVESCGDLPDVAKWATSIVTAQLKTPEGREWALDAARSLASWKSGGPLVRPLIASLRSDLELRPATNRIERTLAIFPLLGPELEPSTTEELGKVLEGALAKPENARTQAEVANTIAMTGAVTAASRQQIQDGVTKLLSAEAATCPDEWSSGRMIDAALRLGPPTRDAVTSQLLKPGPLSSNECVNLIRLNALADFAPRSEDEPQTTVAKSALMDIARPFKTRLAAAKLVTIWERDNVLQRSAFGLEEWMTIHALEAREKLRDDLQREFIQSQYATGAHQDIDAVNICRIEGGLPSLTDRDFTKPDNDIAHPAPATVECLTDHLCGPGSKTYAATMQRCCALGYQGSAA